MDGRREGRRRLELATTIAVRADKIRITERALRRRTIRFASAPQVAARKAAKHGRATGTQAFTLKRVEHLFHGVGHDVVRPSAKRLQPPARNSQAGHVPHP